MTSPILTDRQLEEMATHIVSGEDVQRLIADLREARRILAEADRHIGCVCAVHMPNSGCIRGEVHRYIEATKK